jgi:hypothetical protein
LSQTLLNPLLDTRQAPTSRVAEAHEIVRINMLSADDCSLKLFSAHGHDSGLANEGLFGLRQTIDPA